MVGSGWVGGSSLDGKEWVGGWVAPRWEGWHGTCTHGGDGGALEQMVGMVTGCGTCTDGGDGGDLHRWYGGDGG